MALASGGAKNLHLISLGRHKQKMSLSHYSPPQLSGQITYSPSNHGNSTIMGAIISLGGGGGYNGKDPRKDPKSNHHSDNTDRSLFIRCYNSAATNFKIT